MLIQGGKKDMAGLVHPCQSVKTSGFCKSHVSLSKQYCPQTCGLCPSACDAQPCRNGGTCVSVAIVGSSSRRRTRAALAVHSRAGVDALPALGTRRQAQGVNVRSQKSAYDRMMACLKDPSSPCCRTGSLTANCGSIQSVGTFCAQHGGNGMVPAPQSVCCMGDPCKEEVDGHTCCRPPTPPATVPQGAAYSCTCASGFSGPDCGTNLTGTGALARTQAQSQSHNRTIA